MNPTVTLTVVDGPAEGTYTFTGRDTCFVGRKPGHTIAIPDTGQTRMVSRTHCMFDINPPQVSVRDFGSLNGTYVGGQKIGSREKGQSPEEGAQLDLPTRLLADGDTVTVGPVTLRVSARGARPAATAVPVEPLIRKMVEEFKAGWVPGLPDKYELLGLLGKGGQGIVVLARDQATGQEHAVKLLQPTGEVTDHAAAQFLREIANTLSLRHPNIVRGLDAGTAHGRFYLAMEHCAGGSVHHLVADHGPLDPGAAVSIALDALAGLGHAHTATVQVPGLGMATGLVHRDVKPANILIGRGEDGQPAAKVSDFGLAKAFDFAGLSGLSFTNDTSGTYAFMSRAQFEHFRDAQPRVDVWSMAATLYWMLTGALVRDFPKDFNQAKVFAAILNQDPVPIRRRSPQVPARLAEAIDAALVEEPGAGITTAAEFAAALRGAL